MTLLQAGLRAEEDEAQVESPGRRPFVEGARDRLSAPSCLVAIQGERYGGRRPVGVHVLGSVHYGLLIKPVFLNTLYTKISSLRPRKM